jgi:hypothetical protein
MDRVRVVAPGLGTAAILIAAVGCAPPDPQLRVLRQKVDQLEVENDRLETGLLARGADVADLEAQVAKLLELGPARLEKLFVVDRIELVSRTGGADYDGQMGDDGVTVYLRPLDADGDVLKAAGEITVELLDTNDPGSPRSLGLYVHNDPEQLRRLWYGGFLTNHYTIKCPWDPAIGPPANREVTVKATFYDFLTGRRFTATKVVEVALPN